MIDNFLSRLEKVRPRGDNKWQACCPAHNDKSPSMSIKDTGQKIIVYCHAGCSVNDITAAVGLTVSDLFHEPLSDSKRQAYKEHYSKEQRQYDETLLMVCKSDRERGEKICREDLILEEQAWRRLHGNS